MVMSIPVLARQKVRRELIGRIINLLREEPPPITSLQPMSPPALDPIVKSFS